MQRVIDVTHERVTDFDVPKTTSDIATVTIEKQQYCRHFRVRSHRQRYYILPSEQQQKLLAVSFRKLQHVRVHFDVHRQIRQGCRWKQATQNWRVCRTDSTDARDACFYRRVTGVLDNSGRFTVDWQSRGLICASRTRRGRIQRGCGGRVTARTGIICSRSTMRERGHFGFWPCLDRGYSSTQFFNCCHHILVHP